jgi:hypothetical protein
MSVKELSPAGLASGEAPKNSSIDTDTNTPTDLADQGEVGHDR